MNQNTRSLVEALWEASTGATREVQAAAIARACDAMAVTTPAEQATAERYVRSCLVAQQLAA